MKLHTSAGSEYHKCPHTHRCPHTHPRVCLLSSVTQWPDASSAAMNTGVCVCVFDGKIPFFLIFLSPKKQSYLFIYSFSSNKWCSGYSYNTQIINVGNLLKTFAAFTRVNVRIHITAAELNGSLTINVLKSLCSFCEDTFCSSCWTSS